MAPRIETRGRKPNGEIPLTWMRFGKYLFDNGYNATDAYRKAFPKAKGTDDSIAWKAFCLKRKLEATNWFHELLDRAGLTEKKLSENIRDLANAERTILFQKNGEIIERKVPDNQTRVAANKLALEARRLLIQRQEIDARVSELPTTFTGWIKQANAQPTSENESPDAPTGDATETAD